jgi:hypothetical protein
MRIRAVLVVLLAAASVISNAPRSEETGQKEGTPAPILYVTRVFHTQGMELEEARTLLRPIHLRRFVWVQGRDAIVVSSFGDDIARSESLLKEKGVLVRAVEPFAPMYLEDLPKEPAETRTYHVPSEFLKSAQSMIRTFFDVREVTISEEDHTVSARASLARLEAAEALFKELDLLEKSAGSP